MPTRRERIEDMLVQEPEDSFLRYGLAIEFDNEERFDDAVRIFASLMNDHPPYIAAFLRGAQLLVKIGRIEEARTVLRRGIEEARAQGAGHPAGEMAELLTELGAMGE